MKPFMLAVLLLAAGSASASPCQARITTYWGHYASDNSVFCFWGGTGVPPVVVGETIRDCNGQLSSWGTLCDIYEPTVEYVDCGCEYAAAEEDQNKTDELPACAVS
jgi:hypothetical protein